MVTQIVFIGDIVSLICLLDYVTNAESDRETSDEIMAYTIYFTVFIGLVAFASVVESQRCVLNMTSLNLQQNFDFNKFMGRWFELSGWFHRVVDRDQLWDDHYRLYTKRNSTTADYMTAGRPRTSDSCLSWTGHQVIAGTPSHPARLTWKIRTRRGTFADRAVYILRTDYDNYAVTVECHFGATLNDNGTCTPDPNVYVLGRKPFLEPDHYALVNNIIIMRICHANLEEFRPTFHNKACPIPKAASATTVWQNVKHILLVSILINLTTPLLL